MLIYGNDLIEYLKANNNQNKCKTAFDEMYCMKCQDVRPVLGRKVSVEQKDKFLKVQGVCRTCKARMFKNYKLSDFPDVRRTFRLVDVLELYDSTTGSDKTHLLDQDDTPQCEPIQGSLF